MKNFKAFVAKTQQINKTLSTSNTFIYKTVLSCLRPCIIIIIMRVEILSFSYQLNFSLLPLHHDCYLNLIAAHYQLNLVHKLTFKTVMVKKTQDKITALNIIVLDLNAKYYYETLIS